MITPNPFARNWDVCVNHTDLSGARARMADICGPHLLKAARPELIHFQHSGHVMQSLSTTLGRIGYGTDVTVAVDDETNLNCYSLTLPITGQQELAAGGQLWRSDCDWGVILSPFETQELNITGDCRELHVAVPRFSMHSVLEELLQRPTEEPIRFAPHMDAVNGASGSWWRMARHLIDEFEHNGTLYGQLLFNRDMETALIKGLILAQPNNYTAELQQRHAARPPHYLVRARAFIHAHAREELRLEDIEQAAGISRVKLFEGFKRHFGSSPMAYLRRYRLTAIRQQLLDDSSARNVSPIAMAWGFNHLGRFSSDYRKLFGEPPSATLARKQRGRDLAH